MIVRVIKKSRNPAIATTYYNNGIGPDSYPSPDWIIPYMVMNSMNHLCTLAGLYYLALMTTDDDGGGIAISTSLSVHRNRWAAHETVLDAVLFKTAFVCNRSKIAYRRTPHSLRTGCRF